MRLYSVYLRDHGRDPERDMIFVKYGFSLPAFLFTFLWALWVRAWWVALGLFAVVVLSGLALNRLGVGENLEAILTLALAVGIGYVGNDIRRWSLEQAGFSEVAVVAAKNLTEAERRFLEDAEITPGAIYP